jgi:hypothetical protein
MNRARQPEGEKEMAQLDQRELAYREHDGLEITLVWNAVSNEISVAVVDAREELSFCVRVPSEYALDAFNHPYAYAALERGPHHSVLV